MLGGAAWNWYCGVVGCGVALFEERASVRGEDVNVLIEALATPRELGRRWSGVLGHGLTYLVAFVFVVWRNQREALNPHYDRIHHLKLT